MTRLSLLGLTLALAGCRVHTLEDGAYALSVSEVLRDDCALGTTGGPQAGAWVTEGHQVGFTLDTTPALRLEGTYLYGVEQVVLDGTLLNAPATLNGATCQVDTAVFHLESTTVSPTQFEGALSIEYTTRQNDACTCRSWFKVTAAQR